MKILKEVGKSIYGPEYYREITGNEKLSQAFKYFFKFILLTALTLTVVYSAIVIPKEKKFFSKVGAQLLAYYPDELELKLTQGKVSTNVEEPYFFRIPESKDNLIVIDTKTKFDTTTFKKYDAIIWITEDSIVSRKDNDQIEITPLDSIPEDITVNKTKVANWLGILMPFTKWILAVTPFFLFLAFYIFLAGKIVYLLLGALIIWVIMKIKGIPSSYGTSYRLGLHLITLPSLIYLVLPDNLKFFLLYTLILAILAAINLKKEPLQAAPIAPVADTPPQEVK